MNEVRTHGSPSVGYWIFNYMPEWEAASMEIQELANAFRDRFGTSIISLNTKRRRIQLSGLDKHLPLPYAALAWPLLQRAAQKVSINHVFASPGEWLLTPRLARLQNTILTIAKDNPTLDVLEKNLGTLRALRYIVVESERHKELLLQTGITSERVKVIYPGIACQPYRPATAPFSILFATSPPNKYDLLSRGVYLMVKVAKLLPDVTFIMVWRNNPEWLYQLLKDVDVSNIKVIAGLVDDMRALYDSTHAAILPALNDASLKPCPHSGLHALAHGKPLLVSRSASISGIVEREQCGVVFEPTIQALQAAIRELKANYDKYQHHTHATVERSFSRTSFLERYGELYNSLLAHENSVQIRLYGGSPEKQVAK